MPTEAVVGATLPRAREQQEALEAQEARGDPPLGPSEEMGPDTLTLDSGLQTCERIHFYGFQPPSLRTLVTAALGSASTPYLSLPFL